MLAIYVNFFTPALLKDRDTPNNWDRSHSVIARDYFRVKGFHCICLAVGLAEFSPLQH